MSANVELVRSLYPAWERGDFSSAEWADPEIEYVIADGPSPDSGTGRAGMADVVGAAMSGLEDLHTEPVEFRELDGERVLVVVRFVARGRTSGLDLGQTRAQGAHLFHLRAGKVVKYVHYWDRANAVADLDLAGEPRSPAA